ncbi:MAG: DUF1566 domain-containing protein [Magnetococcus sp. DMHC-6]
MKIIKIFLIVLFICFLYFPFSVIWAAGESAPVAETGQTTSYGTNDDGSLRPGVAWPIPRFVDLGDGTISDALTGLIWMKNANCWNYMNWTSAISKIIDLNNGITTCSGYNGNDIDWRLPNKNELASLIDDSHYNPALPSGHPFSSVQTDYSYWSSTTSASSTSVAWYVYLYGGDVSYNDKTFSYYVWPVRSGE